MWCTYAMGYESATKKNKIKPLAAMWRDLETVLRRRKPDKDTYHVISLTWDELNFVINIYTLLLLLSRIRLCAMP